MATKRLVQLVGDFHDLTRDPGPALDPKIGSNMVQASKPIGSMYGIYANIWGTLMVNVTIYGIHGSYGK